MSAVLERCPRCGGVREPGEVVCPRDNTELVPAQLDPLLGQEIGPWRVVRRIGLGGMGAVYEVHEVNIDRRAAMKVVHPVWKDDPSLPGLLDEARAATAINDEALVDVFGFGRLADGRAWLVMDLLEGEPLDQKLARSGRLSVDEMKAIAGPVLSALEAAHAAGFVHRDLKPSNIFLERRGDKPVRPRILDLGLAKHVSTVSPHPVGTPDYVAPEQARNAPVGPRTDLYSLGCVLFETLTGHVPFAGADAQAVINAHSTANRPSVRAERPDVPLEVERALVRLMAIDPRERPASAAEAKRELLGAPPRAAEPGVSKAVLGLAAAALVVALASAALVARRAQVETSSPVEAPPPADDPREVAASKAEGQLASALDAGADHRALELLRASRVAFPGRPSWEALGRELVAQVHERAVARLEAGDAVEAQKAMEELAELGAADEGLAKRLAQLVWAQHNGMVRVGTGYIDRYEHPNRPGVGPTTRVDWSDAVALCSAAGKHLCSEEEWEAACAGSARRTWAWGNDATLGRCTHKDRRITAPTKSGAKEQCVTPEGVYDLSGNVAEWTSSPLREGAPQRVLRGGSFKQSDEKLGCTARDYSLPGLGGAAHIGFRCCL